MNKVSIEEIENNKSEKGGWTKQTLAQWGIPWPPPKGWKEALINGTFQPTSEADLRKMLRDLTMAVVQSGNGHLLADLPEIVELFGGKIPTVKDFVGSAPSAVFVGGVRLDDKVFQFTCTRSQLLHRD